MKVLMVYPEYPVTFWSFSYALKFISKKAAYPPLGLLTVAAMLPPEWPVRLVDMNVERLTDDAILWADTVMVSAMLIQQPSVEAVLQRCRRLARPVIAGGPLFNSLAEEYRGRVEHLVLNEAELTLPMLLRDLAAGSAQAEYRSGAFADLGLTPVPRWDLIQVKKYATVMIQASRGCPFDCEFCDITALYGRVPRVKSALQLLAELDAIHQLGYRGNLFFVDDNFIGNKHKIKQILPEVIQWMRRRDYPFTLLTEASINLADDDELIELMGEAGFDTVFIGIETPNEASLRECSKSQNCRRDLLASVEKLQRAGFHVLGGYIVGFDHDDVGIFGRQIRFIQESGVVTAMVGLLNALPGTRLWQRLSRERRIGAATSGDNTDGTINFIPKMDMEVLLAGYRHVVRTIYSPRQYYRRVSRFLEKYRPRRKHPLHWRDLKAFLKTLFYLGVLGNGASQWYYWKMLVKSLILYRGSMPEAITLMVYGHHFRKVARRL
ncbi:MAG: B12-binding domain-containing radical SAM protein [Syntrophobacteraceae bacterium CG2_30_61_12]|nr:MAG: B12-binding domain-containing radical SAM protein [Syntrophobacteraceae bacterium CG2_30_61_12]